MYKILIYSVICLVDTNILPSKQIINSGEISVTIKDNGSKLTNSNLVIFIEIKNNTSKTIRLLEIVDPEYCSSADEFISLSVSDGGKNVVHKPGIGKMDPGPGTKYAYTRILKGKSYKCVINMKEFLRNKNTALAPGLYRVTGFYANQYGDNCVKGFYRANDLLFRIDK